MGLFLLGIGVGLIIGWIINRIHPDGILVVDDSDELKTNWELRVNTNPEKIPNKRYLQLRVHVQK